VKCELDVFWVAKGGADPVYCLKKYEGRYRILHLKDMTGDDRRTFECVGSGIIDFPSVLKEARKQGIEHFMLEYDNVVDGMACLKTSGAYLKSLGL
jgi:sugar phosphate isomerase/epimerase